MISDGANRRAPGRDDPSPSDLAQGEYRIRTDPDPKPDYGVHKTEQFTDCEIPHFYYPKILEYPQVPGGENLIVTDHRPNSYDPATTDYNIRLTYEEAIQLGQLTQKIITRWYHSQDRRQAETDTPHNRHRDRQIHRLANS